MKPKQPRAPTTFDDQGYAAHKGHFHDKSGKKFATRPNPVDEHGEEVPVQDEPPTEAQVEETVVDVEKTKRKRGRRKLSTANTVLTQNNRGLG